MNIEYHETPSERVLEFGEEVKITITKDGYGMLIVTKEGEEVERYYGIDMAVDHAAELVGEKPGNVELPEEARSMGM